MHLITCQWGYDFVASLDCDRADTLFEPGYNDEVFVCCCKKQEDVLHNQSLKFSLMSVDGVAGGLERVFNVAKPCGKLYDYTEDGIGQTRFPKTKLFGRNAEIQLLYEILTATESDFRVILVHGEPGSGKTSLV